MESWRLCKFSWKCFHFWQCLGLPEWKLAVKKFWAVRTKGDGCSLNDFYGKRCSACEYYCSACDLRVLSTKIWGWLQVMQITIQRTCPAWPAKTKLWMTLDCSRIVKEITMVSETSVEGGRHCFILASDKNKKDQKKSSKQTSRWLPHVVISQRKICNGAYQ